MDPQPPDQPKLPDIAPPAEPQTAPEGDIQAVDQPKGPFENPVPALSPDQRMQEFEEYIDRAKRVYESYLESVPLGSVKSLAFTDESDRLEAETYITNPEYSEEYRLKKMLIEETIRQRENSMPGYYRAMAGAATLYHNALQVVHQGEEYDLRIPTRRTTAARIAMVRVKQDHIFGGQHTQTSSEDSSVPADATPKAPSGVPSV